MSALGLVRKGISQLLAGDVTPIVRHVVDEIDGRFLSDPQIHPGSTFSPASCEEPVSLFWDESDGFPSYYRVVDGQQLSYDPPFSISDIQFDVVDVRDRTDLTVRVTFHCTGGETYTRTTNFRNGRFNERVTIPLRFTSPDPATAVDIEVVDAEERPSTAGEQSGWRSVDRASPLLSLPAGDPAATADYPHVFLISIDSLRYDHLDELGGLIDALGDDAVVPTEPRTQGTQTWQSHGSMFTGLHPGEHGCRGSSPGLPADVVTLPELLEANGYVCRAVTGGGGLLPEFGFGRGFHRYQRKEMSWRTREFDAQTNVNTVVDWAESTVETGTGPGFHFLHLFDAHYPYLPPLPVTDYDRLDYEAMETLIDTEQSSYTYPDIMQRDPLEVDDDNLELARRYYRDSLAYVDRQLRRLVARLKSLGIFDDSLIVVTGDHGEEFGERNLIFHRGLHDANIRPGMVVKPPAGSDIVVPDDPDLIDILPTVATAVGEPVPDQCSGRPWYEPRTEAPRTTEWFDSNYNVAVEQDGYKAIFVYERDGENRPAVDEVEAGPVYEEYHELASLRVGTTERVPEETRRALAEIARRFVSTQRGTSSQTDQSVPEDVQRRLAELGYK